VGLLINPQEKSEASDMLIDRAYRRGPAGTLHLRMNLQDAFMLGAVLCAATLFAFEFDFFENVDQMTSEQRRITVRECFVLAGLLIAGLIGFSFHRLQQQKQEFERRLAAEIAASEARHQAMRDPLTGLPNRRALLAAIGASRSDPKSAPSPGALLLFDLNGFKGVNDQHGHPIGDQVLETIARRMQSIVDGDSIVARLGGDEFAVFCRSIHDRDDLRQMAQRLIAGIEAPIDIAGVRHSVGVGAGIALYPQDGHTEQELLRCADVALYRAKAEKQSAVHFYG
jgi:diguanylate cyclase (GGDEF)-like protein